MNRRVVSSSFETLEPLGQLVTRVLWGSDTLKGSSQAPILLVCVTSSQSLFLVLSSPVPLNGHNNGMYSTD